MRTKRTRVLLYIFTLSVMISLFYKTDLLYGNISGTLETGYNYLHVLSFAFSLALCVYKAFFRFDKKMAILTAFFIVGGALVPYDHNRTFISDLHVLVLYVTFCVITFTIYSILFKIKIYDPKRSRLLAGIFTLSLFLLFLIHLRFLGVNGLMELIFLTNVLVVSFVFEFVIE